MPSFFRQRSQPFIVERRKEKKSLRSEQFKTLRVRQKKKCCSDTEVETSAKCYLRTNIKKFAGDVMGMRNESFPDGVARALGGWKMVCSCFALC